MGYQRNVLAPRMHNLVSSLYSVDKYGRIVYFNGSKCRGKFAQVKGGFWVNMYSLVKQLKTCVSSFRIRNDLNQVTKRHFCIELDS